MYMDNKPTLYEWLLLIIGCTLCLFIIIASITMAVVPTTEHNSEIRKQMLAIISVLVGGIMGILSAKLLDKRHKP